MKTTICCGQLNLAAAINIELSRQSGSDDVAEFFRFLPLLSMRSQQQWLNSRKEQSLLPAPAHAVKDGK